MLGQLNLWGKNKVEVAIDRLKSFEPKDGYYLAFSGGKDSQCIYHLAKEAGVKFDAHYRITSVDPPELVRFIKTQYPDVGMDYPRDQEGNVVTMWSLIAAKTMPPTRMVRYCCEHLKENGGDGRLCVTGVRWAESIKRKQTQGELTVMNPGKELRESSDFSQNARGGVILVNDNAESRRLMERCIPKGKVTLNPIIDWEDDDVWEYLNEHVKISHCNLYDDGFKRIGCIGCPLQGTEGMLMDFAKWPKYRDSYVRAFDKMLVRARERRDCKWKNGEDVLQWWVGNDKKGGKNADTD